jgi:hypothetical protein
MTDQALVDSMEKELVNQLQTINVIEASVEPGVDSESFMVRQIKASVLSRFSSFLANNADLMPSKETVLAMLDRAIDVAFAAMGRPVIANLIKPLVKAQILAIAGNLYDSVFNPPTAEPRVEV